MTSTREDLRSLPGHLDRIDALDRRRRPRWRPQPNAADLQIGASLGLAQAIGDLRSLIAERPCARLADYLAPVTGSVPAGVLPAEWLPANSAMSPASTSG